MKLIAFYRANRLLGGWLPHKLLKVMKLTIILLIIALTQVSASVFSQNISLNEKKSSLEKVLKSIKKQTGYLVLYQDQVMQKANPVTLQVKNVTLQQALDECFSNQPLSYQILENTIIVKTKIPSAVENINGDITIKGKIVDENGSPLPGASVKVKGTNLGVIANVQGEFILKNTPVDVTIVVSFVGYITKELLVKEDMGTIQLMPSALNLNSVVIVGYGTQSRAKVTGAISTVKMDEVLGNRPVSQVSTLLQNVVPGLQSTITSGQPGASTSLNIRGATDLNISGNSVNQGGPLILVDNVPLNGGLNQLDPNDIETITVLKDAGSAAIYGGRSAFGVVLVTTKKGKANQKAQFNYSNNVIFASAMNLPVKATADQFLQSLKDAGTVSYYSGQNVNTWIQLYHDAVANPGKYPTGLATSGSTIYPVTVSNALNDFLGATVPQMQNNFSVSGGTDKTNYRLSFGSVNENGIIVPAANQDYFKRYNLRSFLSSDVNNWLTTQVDASYSNSSTSTPSNPEFDLATNLPVLLVTSDTLRSSAGQLGVNGTPKGIILNGAPNLTQNSDIRLTGRAILKPAKGLTITGEYTYDHLNVNQENYDKMFTNVNPRTFTINPVGSGTYALINGSTIYKALNVFGNYRKSIGDHNFAMTAGYNREESITTGNSTSRNGMISVDYPSLTNATGPLTATNSYSDFSLSGLFWRLNYDYKSKYILQLNERYDGSSKFPENHRFGLFPSGSVGWLASEEGFFKNRFQWLSLLKFRASLGQVGNQNISPFQFTPILPRYQPTWLNGTGSYLTSLTSPSLISSDFTWEKVQTLDFGIDVGLFHNKLNGSFDWYRRETKDILAAGATPLPAVLGTGAPLQNTASLESTGFEIAVNWDDKISQSVSYRIGINLYNFTSKITRFDGNPNDLLSTYYVGQQIGEIRGYTTDRLYTVDDFVPGTLNSNLTGGTLKPGIPKFQGILPNPGDVLFKDLNGDGVIYQGLSTKSNPGDKSIIGNSTPRYQFGVTGGLTFKNFDFSFVIRGVGKQQYYQASNLTFPNYTGFVTPYQNELNYWTPTTPNAFYGRIYDVATGNQSYNQGTIQTRYLLNGAYLQVSNLGLSYSIPANLLNKIQVKSLKIFSSVENPFEFDHLPKGLDPSLSDLGSGLGYPFLRRISFGASVTF
jgi:TonB-linked SusC/RagA family outer membrane protein